MGKKQHQSDKLYLTATEWKNYYGGKKDKLDPSKSEFKRLPFFCCSLSMQPFEHPYCTKEGVIFDLTNIVPFLKQFGVNPVNGQKMIAKDLIKLSFHKNSAGKYHCPVTFRVFNENTHIVAIATTGNIFAYDAIERLNIKPSFWKDLITDEPFTRKDIITIQDPINLQKFNIQSFFHIKKNIKVLDEAEEEAKKDPKYRLNTKALNAETRHILKELDETYTPAEKKGETSNKADAVNAAHYSTGRVAAAFTSTAMGPETQHEAAVIDEDILRYERVKKKAYIRVLTSCGMLNLEIHSDMIPAASENFLKHCKNGYYKNTVFHRSIRNFMIQGGDPEGTGLGGQSIWGKPFKDHFKPNLTHSGRGILSMANSGPDTNKSQFFITYRSAKHLDGKHTVFGRVVGGLDTLTKMEKIETDKKDKPVKEIKFIDAQVFVDPFDEADELLKKEREEAIEKQRKEKEAEKKKIKKSDSGVQKVFREGVGKYISPVTQKRTAEDAVFETKEEKKKKKEAKSTLSNFSAW